MKEYIKLLMFAGAVIVIGDTNAMRDVGHGRYDSLGQSGASVRNRVMRDILHEVCEAINSRDSDRLNGSFRRRYPLHWSTPDAEMAIDQALVDIERMLVDAEYLERARSGLIFGRKVTSGNYRITEGELAKCCGVSFDDVGSSESGEGGSGGGFAVPMVESGSAASVALTGGQPISPELSLLRDIAEQTGLSEGKLNGKEISKENVIDAIRRTIDSYKKTKQLAIRMLTDLQRKFEANPRGTIYQYKGEEDLSKDRLEEVKRGDVSAVLGQQVADIWNTEKIKAVDKVTSVIWKYINARRGNSSHAERVALRKVEEFFKNTTPGSMEKVVEEALFEAKYLQRKDGALIVGFDNTDGELNEDEIVGKIVYACARYSSEFKNADTEAIIELRKQSKADWYDSEIRPKMGLPEEIDRVIDVLSGDGVTGYEG